MKFEKLTDNKIRIIFSAEDMISNNFSTQAFLSDKSISQKVLQSILSRAEKEIGFKTNDSKLLVEAISSDDGFVFTITKLSSCSKINFNNNLTPYSTLIFAFENFDNILDLCTYIKNMNNENLKALSKDTTLIFYNNIYYLYFSNTELTTYDKFLNICVEFGTSIRYSPKLDGLLHEYGKIIFNKDALNKCLEITKVQ